LANKVNLGRRVECRRKEKGVEENQNRDYSKHNNTNYLYAGIASYGFIV
jgi:hypothetical protein